MKLFFGYLLTTFALTITAFAGGAGDGEEDLDLIHFRTPSKNIYCAYNANEKYLKCERRTPSYKLVELYVDSVGRASYNDDIKTSYSNWALSFQLAYGKTWKAKNANLSCASSTTGLICKNGKGNGFKISKAKVSLY